MDPLFLYAVLVFGIIVLPGMDMAFVLSSALAAGRRAGLAAVAGLMAGGAAHVVLGALGAGLLLKVVPGAYGAVLVAGAAYVAWMGWGLWRSSALVALPDSAPASSLRRTFGQAAATCLLNPKAYLFMVAVFPQFIDPRRGAIAAQALALGVITVATQGLVYGIVALGASRLREALGEHPRMQAGLARGVALLLGGTAVWTLAQAWR